MLYEVAKCHNQLLKARSYDPEKPLPYSQKRRAELVGMQKVLLTKPNFPLHVLPFRKGTSTRVLPEIPRLQRQVGRHNGRAEVLPLQHRIDGKVPQLLLLLFEVVFPAQRVS